MSQLQNERNYYCIRQDEFMKTYNKLGYLVLRQAQRPHTSQTKEFEFLYFFEHQPRESLKPSDSNAESINIKF